jgi:hypothetical protein
MTSMLSPTSYRIKETHSRIAGQVRVTRAGLALLRYRQTHGVFPETLDVLDAGDLSDPFADGPLIYRTTEDGFVVYSVGEDRADNGGSPKQPRQNKDYDIVRQWPARQQN